MLKARLGVLGSAGEVGSCTATGRREEDENDSETTWAVSDDAVQRKARRGGAPLDSHKPSPVHTPMLTTAFSALATESSTVRRPTHAASFPRSLGERHGAAPVLPEARSSCAPRPLAVSFPGFSFHSLHCAQVGPCDTTRSLPHGHPRQLRPALRAPPTQLLRRHPLCARIRLTLPVTLSRRSLLAVRVSQVSLRVFPSALMILRIRLPNGATERVTLNPGETLQHLGAKIEALEKMEGQFALYSDIRFTQPFVFPQARHGDIIFIKGVAKATPPAESQTSPPPDASTPDPQPESAASATEDDLDDGDQPQPETATWRPRCRHGPRGMCEHCMPKEDKRERYENELAKWKGRGMSVAVMEALEALKTKITAQPEAHASAVLVDNKAAEQFQAYIARTGFQQQRVGICYGDVTESGETRVLAIYEPPQSGSDQFYSLDDEGDMTHRADTVAQLLGLQRVGIVFSAKPRKCILSGMDVVFAARMAKHLTDEQKKAFVVLVVTTAETGETLFEAYQISDLAMQMYVDGIFEEQDLQKPNSGRVLCKEDVLVEGKDVRKVHTEFFLLNIPIKSCDSWLRTSFAVENRDIAPQGPSDLKKILADDKLSYTQKLSDFHALLFLSNMFDMNTDMPGLLSSIKEGQDIGEGFRLMIDGIASSA